MSRIIDFIADHFGWTLACVCIVLLALCAWAAMKEDESWQAYSQEHHCKANGVQKGQVTIDPSNGHVIATHDQTVYVCDEGEIIIR